MKLFYLILSIDTEKETNVEVLHDFNPDLEDSSAALERAMMEDSKSSNNNVSILSDKQVLSLILMFRTLRARSKNSELY